MLHEKVVCRAPPSKRDWSASANSPRTAVPLVSLAGRPASSGGRAPSHGRASGAKASCSGRRTAGGGALSFEADDAGNGIALKPPPPAASVLSKTLPAKQSAKETQEGDADRWEAADEPEPHD
jgi:hypothetical protein